MKHRRKIFWLTILAVYLTAVSCGRLADRLILFPSTERVDAEGAIRQTITREGNTIECWTARSPAVKGEPEAYVLEFTGNATRAEYIASWVAQRWGAIPVEAWVMNYPGYGGSTGPASLSTIPQAALASYDEIARRAAGKPIFLAGNSLGTTAALYVASQRPCAGLMLQNPPPLQRLILRRHGWWNLWLLAGPVASSIPSELNALSTAPKVQVPAVFLLADQDTVVPASYAKAVADAYAGPKTVFNLQSAGHNDMVPPEIERQLQAELNRLWVQAKDR